jgi:hypothetical protein
MNSLDDAFWRELLTRMAEGEVVPIVGPSAVTFGAEDQLLYPSLVQRLSTALEPPLTFVRPPHALPDIVDAQRAIGQPVERIYKRLYHMVNEPDLRPGPTLATLAAVTDFQLFISTTFDPLLPRAVESATPGGRADQRVGAATLRGACPDLPQELAKMEHRFVHQILGRAEPVRDFVVWDDDILPFLLALNEQLKKLPRLREALQKSHFLVLGLSLTDWLLRFFVQVVKGQRVSELAGSELLVFEQLDPSEREKVVVYFSRLTKQVRVLSVNPVEFISELDRRWRQQRPRGTRGLLKDQEHREKHRAHGCIFVSYASPDLEIATHVVRQLQNAGCRVWFDKEQIQPGESWERALQGCIEERCGLFLSLISDHTAARLEGFNILERDLAARRRKRFAEGAVFYLPMRVDAGEPLIPENEPAGTRSLQAVRQPGGHLDSTFITYLRQKQRENCAALGFPLPD